MITVFINCIQSEDVHKKSKSKKKQSSNSLVYTYNDKVYRCPMVPLGSLILFWLSFLRSRERKHIYHAFPPCFSPSRYKLEELAQRKAVAN